MSPKHNDNVWHVGVEIATPYTVPQKRVEELLLAALTEERIKAHQKDDISYAKIEVTSIRRTIRR